MHIKEKLEGMIHAQCFLMLAVKQILGSVEGAAEKRRDSTSGGVCKADSGAEPKEPGWPWESGFHG